MTVEIPTTPPRRKRGAPAGNRNAYRHGFYAISPDIVKHLRKTGDGEFIDEIEALKGLAYTAIQIFYASPDRTLEQCLSTMRGASQTFDTIKGLYLTKKLLYNNQTSMQQIIEELGHLPVDQD